SMILYWPCSSLTTLRTFSISTGLLASTVTPGSTPPDVSFTTPAMPPVPCALTMPGNSTRHIRAARLPLRIVTRLIIHSCIENPPTRLALNECPLERGDRVERRTHPLVNPQRRRRKEELPPIQPFGHLHRFLEIEVVQNG